MLMQGIVSFLAGKLGTSGSANGAGVFASFTAVHAMTLDSSSYLYVADENSIRRVSTCKTAATYLYSLPLNLSFYLICNFSFSLLQCGFL